MCAGCKICLIIGNAQLPVVMCLPSACNSSICCKAQAAQPSFMSPTGLGDLPFKGLGVVQALHHLRETASSGHKAKYWSTSSLLHRGVLVAHQYRVCTGVIITSGSPGAQDGTALEIKDRSFTRARLNLHTHEKCHILFYMPIDIIY